MAGLTSSFAGILLMATTGGMGLPFGVPPAPEDPAIARAVPEECLYCLSWAGTAAPDPKSANQTEQLLAEQEVQYFLKKIDHLTGYVPAAEVKSQGKENVKEFNSTIPGEVVRSIVTHPGIIFVSKISAKGKPDLAKIKNGSQIEGGMVFALGEDAERMKVGLELWSASLQGITKAMNDAIKENVKDQKAGDGKNEEKKEQRGDAKPPENAGGAQAAPAPAVKAVAAAPLDIIKIDGEDYRRIPSMTPEQPCIVYGFHGNYFIVGVGEKGAEGILARMKGDKPSKWWTDIGMQLPVQRRSIVSYLNLRMVKEVLSAFAEDKQQAATAQSVIELLGLSNATALVEAWGLEDEDFCNKTLLMLDGPPGGLLQLVSDNPLKPEDLQPIPRDSTLAAAFRLDLEKAAQIIHASLAKMDPKMVEANVKTLDQWEKELGIDLRHGTLKSMGDTWCVFNSPHEGGFVMTGMTAVVPLRDWAGMNIAYGKLMGAAKKLAPQQGQPGVGEPVGDMLVPGGLQHFNFQGTDVYCVQVPGVPIYSPSWCMTKKEMIFSMSPQNIKAFLIRDERHEPLQRIPRVAKLFADDAKPAMIAYGDSARMFEMLYPILVVYSAAMHGAFGEGATSELLDPSFFPSGLSINRHIGPSVATLRRTKHGIEFVTRGTIPLPSATCLIGMYSLGIAQINQNAVVPPPPAQATPTVAPAPATWAPAPGQGTPAYLPPTQTPPPPSWDPYATPDAAVPQNAVPSTSPPQGTYNQASSPSSPAPIVTYNAPPGTSIPGPIVTYYASPGPSIPVPQGVAPLPVAPTYSAPAGVNYPIRIPPPSTSQGSYASSVAYSSGPPQGSYVSNATYPAPGNSDNSQNAASPNGYAYPVVNQAAPAPYQQAPRPIEAPKYQTDPRYAPTNVTRLPGPYSPSSLLKSRQKRSTTEKMRATAVGG
jgi:hypothetical protein